MPAAAAEVGEDDSCVVYLLYEQYVGSAREMQTGGKRGDQDLFKQHPALLPR